MTQALPAVGYIASTIPARVVRLSGTTLFHIAMITNGDPLQWPAIAIENGVIDPWIFAQMDVLIPPVFPIPPTTGILGA